MMKKLIASCCVVTAAVLFAAACGKPARGPRGPKQAEVADPTSDKGADMTTGEEPGGAVKPVEGAVEKDGEAAMHDKCCGQCRQALSKDRSGGAPGAIPCTDFTATLDPFCLEHFRGRKTMASECK